MTLYVFTCLHNAAIRHNETCLEIYKKTDDAVRRRAQEAFDEYMNEVYPAFLRHNLLKTYKYLLDNALDVERDLFTDTFMFRMDGYSVWLDYQPHLYEPGSPMFTIAYDTPEVVDSATGCDTRDISPSLGDEYILKVLSTLK